MGTSTNARRDARRTSTSTSPGLLRTSLAGLLTTGLVLGGALNASGPAAATTEISSGSASGCADAVLLALPGSGQGGASSSPDLGPVLQPLAERTVRRAARDGRVVEVQALQADTAAAGTLRGDRPARQPAADVVRRASWATWRASVPGLARSLRGALEAVATCPDELVYLLGYAQGAEAAHRVLAERAADEDLRSRVVSTLLVADPLRPGTGVSSRFARTPVAALPLSGWSSATELPCASHDVVCDLDDAAFAEARRAHRSYSRDPEADTLLASARRSGARLALFPRPAVADQRVLGRVGTVMSDQLDVDVARSARDDVRWRPTTDLPPGLSLSGAGRLSGNPTTAGTFEVGYTVRNVSATDLSRAAAGRALVTVDDDLGSGVATGGRHSCSVRADATLWCWGANFEGQLGLGDHLGRRAATQVGQRATWQSVSGGGMHTCAVRTDHTLWCWGLNYRGQLGLGGKADHDRPQQVGTDEDWASVSAGWVHTCALRTDGSAWCWGNNAFGQLGSGSTHARYEPRRVAGAAAWSTIHAGGWSTCGVHEDGSAWCWGRNLNGELGVGDSDLRTQPTRVGADRTWASVQPSWTHTCALTASGSAWCWGNNAERQLGTGAAASSATPVAVAGDHRFAQISTGNGFGCGIDVEAALWCWGDGRYGENGTFSTAPAPVRVGVDGGWVALDSGWLHTCAVRSTGAPRCWGENEVGALGDGTDLDRSTPTPVTYAAGQRDAAERMRTSTLDPHPAPPTRTAQRPGTTGTHGRDQGARAASEPFTVVSFNALGSNHTAPRLDAAEYSPARVRSEWAIDHLDAVDASIVGFQEIQRDQLAWFLRGAGARYDVWPGTDLGSQGIQTTIAWKQRTWEMTAHATVEIPFITQKRLMPLVKLRNRESGRSVWVMNVHNAPQDLQDQRNRAVELEISRLEKVVGKGAPVLLVGDFNERERVYCAVGDRLGMVAPRGGSVDGGGCNPPGGYSRVDWIFGTPDASYSRYVEDRSPLVKRVTDHAVLRTRVALG